MIAHIVVHLFNTVQCSAVHAKFYLCLSIYVSLNSSYSSILNVMTEQSNFMTSMKLCEPQKCKKCPDVRLILSRLHPLVSVGTVHYVCYEGTNFNFIHKIQVKANNCHLYGGLMDQLQPQRVDSSTQGCNICTVLATLFAVQIVFLLQINLVARYCDD